MATGDLSYPYDVKLTIQGESPRGFMLSVPQDGTKQVLLEESPPPNLLRDFDEFSEVFRNSNPRNDVPFVITDLSGGVGQLYYDEGDTTKYRWSNGLITHVKGKAYLPPKVTTNTIGSGTNASKITSVQTAGYLQYYFIHVGGKLYRLDPFNIFNPWELVWTATGGDILGLHYFNDKLFILGLFGGGVDFYVQNDITLSAPWTPTAKSHTTLPANVTYDAKSIGNTFYIREPSGRIYFSTDPENDSWSGPILVGDPNGGVGSYRMIVVNDMLFIINSLAIYSIDSTQEVREVVWQFKDLRDRDSIKYNTGYNSELIFSIFNELYAYNPLSGSLEKLSFSNKDSFSVREILGLASDINFLYILARVTVPGIYSVDQVALFAAHRRNNEEWVYEVIASEDYNSNYTYNYLTAAWGGISSNYTFLMWSIWKNDGTDVFTKKILNKFMWDQSPDTLGLDQFESSKSLWTSITKANYPGLTKRHTYLEGNFLNTATGRTVSVDYSTDNGATHSNLATYTSNTALTNYDNVYGTVFSLKITLSTNDPNKTPVLLDIASHQKIRFRFIPQITLAIRVASDLSLRNGNRDTRKIWDVWNDLVALRTTDKDILYEDFWGNQFEVTVDLLQSSNVKHIHPNNPELEAILVLTRKDKGD